MHGDVIFFLRRSSGINRCKLLNELKWSLMILFYKFSTMLSTLYNPLYSMRIKYQTSSLLVVVITLCFLPPPPLLFPYSLIIRGKEIDFRVGD